ncbi:hypothetical protein RUM43_007177 [Polyplax serrata]|uniref:Uncharacterized protein n=1 Tax=Polyplax serrata TaxID=468196 RepID=A0AAN8PLV1_POLSC
MSVGHREASFNHSCLKVPEYSSGRRPFSKHERISSAGKEDDLRKQSFPISNYRSNFQTMRSYLKFYESIPDYTELHHLSNEEFYSQLKSLKITQKKFYDESGVWNFISEPDNRKIEKINSEENLNCSVCCLDKDYCSALNNEKIGEKVKPSTPKINIISDNDYVSELYESEFKKNSDYEADQESSTLQPGVKSRRTRKTYPSARDEYLSCYSCHKQTRSLPLSSGCECESPEFCRGYSGTKLRDSCYHGNFGYHNYHPSSPQKSLGKLSRQQVPNLPIPLTSRIPLYDKIMEEKEARRKAIHMRYSEKLRSLVQPFSFTKREERNKIHRMVRSNPELSSSQTPVVRFKAKPIPKNLFSDYAYERMRDEEFYRALKRRVRAEEMLKASSLPPSMALRERKYLSKSMDLSGYDDKSSTKTWGTDYRYRRTCSDIRRGIELDQKCKSNAIKNKNHGWLLNKSRRVTSTTDSSTEVSPYESVLSETAPKRRPHSAFSTRSNLASILRVETARKRLEREMEDKLIESRLKDEAKLKAHIVRMSPEWRALNYDKDEDLALRLAARREEERMRQEKHHKLMKSMYGRVYRMPPLFHKERFHNGKSLRKRTSMKVARSRSVADNNCHGDRIGETYDRSQQSNATEARVSSGIEPIGMKENSSNVEKNCETRQPG